MTTIKDLKKTLKIMRFLNRTPLESLEYKAKIYRKKIGKLHERSFMQGSLTQKEYDELLDIEAKLKIILKDIETFKSKSQTNDAPVVDLHHDNQQKIEAYVLDFENTYNFSKEAYKQTFDEENDQVINFEL